MKRLILFILTVLVAGVSVHAQAPVHTFALGDSVFLLDGKPLQMISGEMHCYRIPRAYWRDRLRKARAMGLNTIGTYIFWNMHEPEPGKFDFTGNNDIAAFVRMAKEEGLWVVMRPSPYACAEWEFGGYPYWLLKDSMLKVRSRDPRFLAAYRRYMNALAKQLIPLQVTHGGNILMIQIENEYGSYGHDVAYLDSNRQIFRDAGLDVPLFTCNPTGDFEKGVLPGCLPAVNGSTDPAEIKTLVNKYHGGKGPYYVAEWYTGWFDFWSHKHATRPSDDLAVQLDRILGAGISINMYMFHGGTTRGFMNGSYAADDYPYVAQVSSYDYDSPLDEAGEITPKFLMLRKVIEHHLPPGKHLPPIPATQPAMVIPPIALRRKGDLFDNLPKPVLSSRPLSFEELNQAYGFVLYRTTFHGGGGSGPDADTSGGPLAGGGAPGGDVLRVEGLRDYATVYLDGKWVAVLDRGLKQDSVILDHVRPGAVLDILVENNGRINWGPKLTDNRCGITGEVSLSGSELRGWKMYDFPFSTLNGWRFSGADRLHRSTGGGQPGNLHHPAIYRGAFTLDHTANTFLDMRGFGKGFVFLNGYNLGKYWEIGPQQTIYVPGCWLKTGVNDLEVFDELKGGHTTISTLDTPILNERSVYAGASRNHG